MQMIHYQFYLIIYNHVYEFDFNYHNIFLYYISILLN
jgi:hypothetical protein